MVNRVCVNQYAIMCGAKDATRVIIFRNTRNVAAVQISGVFVILTIELPNQKSFHLWQNWRSIGLASSHLLLWYLYIKYRRSSDGSRLFG